jgi:hypothetical protein
VQVKAGRGAPARVQIDLHALAQFVLQSLGHPFDRLLKFVDRIEHERRAFAQVSCEVGGQETRDAGAALRAARVPDVGRDGNGLAVLHQTQARVVEAVTAQHVFERRPRHEGRELPRAPADVREGLSPTRVEKLLPGPGLQKLVQTVERHL